MSGKPGQQTTKGTEVADKYDGDFVEALDGRYRTARTLRQRLSQLTADLGGLAELSYQERSLCRRAIHLERHIEKKELSLAHGGTIDENTYLTSVNVLSGLFTKIGLKRRARTLTLNDYLANGKATTPSTTKAAPPVSEAEHDTTPTHDTKQDTGEAAPGLPQTPDTTEANQDATTT
jgi:hypothetical protein